MVLAQPRPGRSEIKVMSGFVWIHAVGGRGGNLRWTGTGRPREGFAIYLGSAIDVFVVDG